MLSKVRHKPVSINAQFLFPNQGDAEDLGGL